MPAHRKTHCKRGHAFTSENILVKHDGRRRCRTCSNDWQREKARSCPRKTSRRWGIRHPYQRKWPSSRDARFWTKVERRDPDWCWEWTAGVSGNGLYGHFYIGDGRAVRAHRYAYETLVGPIPEGLEIDHLCRNVRCVNPKHLEPVTHDENMRRRARLGLLERAA